jgi:hypothetical protein
MHSKATTAKDYLTELPKDRRMAIEAVREVILTNLPSGYEEAMNWADARDDFAKLHHP